MSDEDLYEQIRHLETQIEDLALAAERCRRISLVARAAMAVGGLWALSILGGAARLDAAAVTGVTTFILGGIVLFGSNASTARQTASNIKTAEARRAELIGRIEFATPFIPDRSAARVQNPYAALG